MSRYDGLNIRPALRIHYRDTRSGAASAIRSFADTSERESILNELHRFAGYAMIRS